MTVFPEIPCDIKQHCQFCGSVPVSQRLDFSSRVRVFCPSEKCPVSPVFEEASGIVAVGRWNLEMAKIAIMKGEK